MSSSTAETVYYLSLLTLWAEVGALEHRLHVRGGRKGGEVVSVGTEQHLMVALKK